MNILLLCPTMHRVGTWFRCQFLGEALARRGHQVTLVKVAADRRVLPRTSQEGGLRLVETPRFWGGRFARGNTRLPSDLAARFALATREPYDVVHSFAHHFNTSLPGLWAKLCHPRSVLVADWDDLWTEGGLYGDGKKGSWLDRVNYVIDHQTERRLKLLADGVVVVSHDLRERALRDGVGEEQLLYLPNGAPVEHFRPGGDRPALRRELGLPVAGRLLAFVGFGQYDVDLILDAMAALVAQGRTPHAVFAGPHPEITAAGAQARGLSQAVTVLGLLPFSQLPQVLAAAEIGLLPYADKPLNRARWPIKLGDYLAAGLPVATCRVGEMGRFVDAFRVGVATAPSAPAYAEGLAQLLDLGEPEFAEMGRRARSTAEEHTWDVLAEQAEAFYTRLGQRART